MSGLAALALGGCVVGSDRASGDAEARLARALEGRTAGATSQCIDQSRVEGPMIYGSTILYRDGRRLWRTEAVDGCPGLRTDSLLVVETMGGRLCANDRFRAVDRPTPAIPGPYCRFGPFTPYTK